ncbi:hypothetical protein, partial [Pseudomonas avellanae]
VAEVHPPDFSQHFHADHPVFSCSKSEQKQLNTWVSFQSAEQRLLGQFSVSGNTDDQGATRNRHYRIIHLKAEGLIEQTVAEAKRQAEPDPTPFD